MEYTTIGLIRVLNTSATITVNDRNAIGENVDDRIVVRWCRCEVSVSGVKTSTKKTQKSIKEGSCVFERFLLLLLLLLFFGVFFWTNLVFDRLSQEYGNIDGYVKDVRMKQETRIAKATWIRISRERYLQVGKYLTSEKEIRESL